MVILLVFGGCNGVKTVGNTVETYDGIRIDVSEDFRYIDSVDCNDYVGSADCQRRAVNYRADLYIKDSNGKLEALCVVISKSLTGNNTFWYDSGKSFRHEGIRYSAYNHRFDLSDPEAEPEIAAHKQVLQENGISIDAQFVFATALSKRVDPQHKIVIGYAVPESDEYKGMSTQKVGELLRERLLSVVSVNQDMK